MLRKFLIKKLLVHYRFLRLYDPISPFLSASDASEAFKEVNLRQRQLMMTDEQWKNTLRIYFN